MRSWRPITWFIAVTNAIFPLWLLHGLSLAERQTCTSDGCTTFGQGSSPLIPMLLLWLVADLIMGTVWALTLPREPGQGPSPFS